MSIATEISRLQSAKADIKTAIEGKGVTVPSSALLDDYADLIDSIETGGGSTGYTVDEIAQNQEPSGDVVLNTATSIGSYALAGKTGITSISGANVTSLGYWSLVGCTGITSLDFPNLHTIGERALQSVNMENITFTAITEVGIRAFVGNTHIKTINLPNFIGNTTQKIFNDYALQNCSKLTNLILPSLSRGGWTGSMFSGCSSLKLIDFGKHNITTLSGLPSCPLDTLILRKTDSVHTLSSSSVLNSSTAFKSGGTGGTVYIPEVMFDHLGDGSSLDYKASTNWAVYDGYGTITWAKLEGSPYESIYWGANA